MEMILSEREWMSLPEFVGSSRRSATATSVGEEEAAVRLYLGVDRWKK